MKKTTKLSKAAIKKATALSNAAKKAWATRRANAAAAAITLGRQKRKTTLRGAVKQAEASFFTPAFTSLVTKHTATPVRQKLVKGLIKDVPTQTEIGGAFGISNINARGLTKAQMAFMVPVTPAPQPRKYASLKELFAGNNSWIKGVSAKNAAGNVVSADSAEATCFCLSAAVRRVYALAADRMEVTRKLEAAIRTYTMGASYAIVNFNDAATTTLVDIRRVVAFADV